MLFLVVVIVKFVITIFIKLQTEVYHGGWFKFMLKYLGYVTIDMSLMPCLPSEKD